jgi:hypothetical protein
MQFHLEDSQILDATARNFIAWATWWPVVAHPIIDLNRYAIKTKKKSLLVSRRRSV